MVTQGNRLPNFELPGADGDEIAQYELEDYLETGVVCLVFYPFDFSPVCTDTLCTFRDAEFLVFTEGVDVFGISTDSAYVHQRFIDEYNLPFPLLSDNDGTVSEQYDILYDEWEGHNRVSKRAFLVVGEDREVEFCWEVEDANEACDLDVLIEARETVETFPS